MSELMLIIKHGSLKKEDQFWIQILSPFLFQFLEFGQMFLIPYSFFFIHFSFPSSWFKVLAFPQKSYPISNFMFIENMDRCIRTHIRKFIIKTLAKIQKKWNEQGHSMKEATIEKLKKKSCKKISVVNKEYYDKFSWMKCIIEHTAHKSRKNFCKFSFFYLTSLLVQHFTFFLS